MRESLVWRGSRPLPIIIVVFLVEKWVKVRRGLSSLCKAQLSLQVIYFLLHGLFVILSLGYVTTHTGMAPASLSGVHAPLPKPSVLFVLAMLVVWEVTLLLGFGRLGLTGACSMGA